MIKRAEKYLQLIQTRLTEYDELIGLLRESIGDYYGAPNYKNKTKLSGLIAYFEKFELPKFTQLREKEYEQSPEKLTIYIDKNWKAFEFDKIFKSLDFLNKIFTLQQKLRMGESRLTVGETRDYIYKNAKLYHYLAPYEELRVTRIEYASPG